MGHIFISHAEEDRLVAEELSQSLSAEGFETWHYEQNNRVADNFLTNIARAVEEAQAFVLIISRDSFNSHYVEKEVTRAVECRKPIVPLLYKINHEEFRTQKPGWSFAIGATVTLPIPRHDVSGVVPEVVACLKKLGADEGPDRRPASVPLLRRLRRRARSWRLRVAAAVLCAAAAVGLLLWLSLPPSSLIDIAKAEGLLAGKYDGDKRDVVYTFDGEMTNRGPEDYTIPDIGATLNTFSATGSTGVKLAADKWRCYRRGTQDLLIFPYTVKPIESVRMTCEVIFELRDEAEAPHMMQALLGEGVRQQLIVSFKGEEGEEAGRLRFCFSTGKWPFNTRGHNAC